MSSELGRTPKVRAADKYPDLSVDRPQSQVPTQRLTPDTPLSKTSALYRFKSVASQPVVASFLAGGIAGAVSRTVVSPLERLKILFQVQSAGRNAYQMSIGKALGKMWKEEGLNGFMAGNGTNCIRIVPYSAVQFGAYNMYKPVWYPNPARPVSDDCSTLERLLVLSWIL
jgi:solute carrier family 25 (mitochondrial phosphate transporter), member 23/24/25/41